jgi:D-glycerate 3-kinase
MSPKEIANFVQHYEKITKWMLKIMPNLANIVLYVDKDQKISKIKKNK